MPSCSPPSLCSPEPDKGKQDHVSRGRRETEAAPTHPATQAGGRQTTFTWENENVHSTKQGKHLLLVLLSNTLTFPGKFSLQKTVLIFYPTLFP